MATISDRLRAQGRDPADILAQLGLSNQQTPPGFEGQQAQQAQQAPSTPQSPPTPPSDPGADPYAETITPDVQAAPQAPAQGPSMDDLNRALQSYRDNAGKAHGIALMRRGIALSNGFSPESVDENKILESLAPGVQEVLQRQKFAGTQNQQALQGEELTQAPLNRDYKTAQLNELRGKLAERAEQTTAGSPFNRSEAAMLNDLTGQFGMKPIDPNTYVHEKAASILRAAETLAAQQGRKDEFRARMAESAARQAETRTYHEGLLNLGGRRADTGDRNADTAEERARIAAERAAKGTAPKQMDVKATGQLATLDTLDKEIDKMPSDLAGLSRWAQRVNDIAATAVGQGRLNTLLMKNISSSIPGSSSLQGLVSYASPAMRKKMQTELKSFLKDERASIIGAQQKSGRNVSGWQEPTQGPPPGFVKEGGP